MKNSIKCKSCAAENPQFVYICRNCGSFLRERAFNIDLWKTIGQLVESPTKAFRRILNAEHKNFIIFIIFLLAIKFLIEIRLLAVVTVGEFTSGTKLIFSYLIVLFAFTGFLALFSYVIKIVLKSFEYETRFRDNITLIGYALIPNLFSLVLLFPLEMELFGEYLFSSNPSPFVIKSTIAYLFLSAEILIKLWTFFLLFKSLKVQTGENLIAIVCTIAFIFLFISLQVVLSLFIFTI